MPASRVLVCLVLILGCANAKTSLESRLTFTDSARRFTFSYPKSAVVFTSQNMHEAPRQLPSYIPICDENAIVCVGYPPSTEDPDALPTYDGTNFEQASFQVLLISNANNAAQCLDPLKGMQSQTPVDVPKVAYPPAFPVNGVRFTHALTGAAAAGHQISRDLFRAFRGGTCYELSLNVTTTNIGNYEPGTVSQFTSADRERVLIEYLGSIFNSFRFTDTPSPLH